MLRDKKLLLLAPFCIILENGNFLLSAVFSLLNTQFIEQLHYTEMVQRERARGLGSHRQLLIYVHSIAYASYLIII